MSETLNMTKTSELILQEGEELLITGSPVRALQWVLFLKSTLVLLCTVVGFTLLPFVLWAVVQQVQWHRWWLTNRRIVVRTGVIGWELRSIPLNRISDVSLSSSWLDRMFGIQHLTIRDMTGSSPQSSFSSRMLGVPDAYGVQQALLAKVATSETRSQPDQLQRIVTLLEKMCDEAA